MKLKFYGASDDLFLMARDGSLVEEIGNCANGAPLVYRVDGSSGEAMLVVGFYGPSNTGCWSVGVAQVDEDAPLPAWPMHFELADKNGYPGSIYSVALVIEAPAGTKVAAEKSR